MTFGWAKGVAALAMIAALAACGRGAEPVDQTAAENARAAQFFMASNAKAEGVHTLPSGVQYKVVTAGPPGGEKPDGNDLVRVDYEGTLTDGTVFDSSFTRGQPAVFTVEADIPGMSVVEGWRVALREMRVGDEWIVYIPPELGYGDHGQGEIPPNSVLVFRLKLLDIARTPGDGARHGVAMG